MQVVVLASRKGGVGKTTLTGHMAHQATLLKDGPVAILDTDPMGGLSMWWNEREAGDIIFANSSIAKLPATLTGLRERGVGTVIIDTPPQASAEVRKVVQVADLVVIPSRASPHDLRAIGATVDLVREVGKPFVFVINGAAHRANITTNAVAVLSQHGPVSPVIVHHRQDFAYAMIDGETVQGLYPKSKSASEIAQLWAYVKHVLSQKRKTR